MEVNVWVVYMLIYSEPKHPNKMDGCISDKLKTLRDVGNKKKVLTGLALLFIEK